MVRYGEVNLDTHKHELKKKRVFMIKTNTNDLFIKLIYSMLVYI